MTSKICDRLWKEAIKKRAGGQCEWCMSRQVLQGHHIFSRTYWSVRFDLENGVCLCRYCHIFRLKKENTEFWKWIKTIRDIEYLELRKHSPSKNDYKLIEIMLRQELK